MCLYFVLVILLLIHSFIFFFTFNEKEKKFHYHIGMHKLEQIDLFLYGNVEKNSMMCDRREQNGMRLRGLLLI